MAAEMKKAQSWIDGFEELKSWMGEHPEIRVSKTSLSIPKRHREEVYRRLDEIQELLSEQLMAPQAKSAREIASRCHQVRKQLIEATNLVDFQFAAALENLIASPGTAFARPILGLVMDALQQGLTVDEVEDRGLQLMIPFAQDLIRNAYEAWAYCSILMAMKPTHIYGIFSKDTVSVAVVDTDCVKVGMQVTSPENRHPEMVIQTESGRIFAVKMEVGIELEYYGTKVTRKQDFSSGGNTADQIAHRVLMIYEFPSLDEVGTLADRGKLYIRPTDLMCELLLPSEMERGYLVSQFVRRIRTVRSRRPVQVLTVDERGEFPEGMLEDPQVPKIQRHIVGDKEEVLQKIAENFLNSAQKGEST